MPELPEVETVRRGLAKSVKGAVIHKVLLRRKDLRTPFPPGLERALAGRTIRHIDRRAKYLLFELDDGQVLVAHLGMSGKFLVKSTTPKAFDKHDHVVFYLDDGRVMIFNDARRFGLMTLVDKKVLESHPLFSELGPEPLGNRFSPDYLEKALAKRKGPIKPVLMDQKLVVGVGNIYASEALFLAGISPSRPALKAAKQADKLVVAIRKVLNDAIDSGGSSLRDFIDVSGQEGYFQHQFNVYEKAGKPCVSCNKPIRSIRQAGRSTYYCASCQR